MAIKTRDEIITAVKTRLGEAPDDDGVVLLEDLTDTFDDYDSRIAVDIESERASWEEERAKLVSQLEETDRAWRSKYAERFGEGRDTNKTIEESTEIVDEGIDETEITVDDLFNGESEDK